MPERKICRKVWACRYQEPSPEHLGDRFCGRRWADGRSPDDCTAPFLPVRMPGRARGGGA